MSNSFAAWRRDISPALRRSKTAPILRLKPFLEINLRSNYLTALFAAPVTQLDGLVSDLGHYGLMLQ